MQNEKPKGIPSRTPIVIYGLIAILSLVFGITMTISLYTPEPNIIDRDDRVNIDTTPTGLAYLLYVTEDIPCGTLLHPDMVIQTHPEEITITVKGQVIYPQTPRVQYDQVPQLYTLYASRDIKRGENIGSHNLAEAPTCPTQSP